MADAIPDGYVAVARVLRPHGVRGELKVEPLAPLDILTRGREVSIAGRSTVIEHASKLGRHLRLKLRGVEDRKDAATLNGRWLLASDRSLPPLPEGQYYRFQLLGVRVVTTDGQELGTVEDIFSVPENDVYVVKRGSQEILLPATDDVILNVDVSRRVMTIDLVPGLLP